MERVVVGGVYVRFGGRYSNFDFILILPSFDDTEIRANFVVTFRAPRDVMYVCKLSDKVRVRPIIFMLPRDLLTAYTFRTLM